VSVRVKGKARGQLDVKRFYLPGVTISDDCPKCRREVAYPLSTGNDRYLSYPIVGEPSDFHFYCHECGAEWTVRLLLTISLKPAPEEG
jgi:hypothetical protein